jgi:16S rRNA (guanine527-N7)-methyltransferase
MGLTATEAAIVERTALAFGVDLPDDAIHQLGAFLDLLSEWTIRYRLVGTRDRETLVRKHLADSLAPAYIIHENQIVVDIGSGAGFPAVPLAITCITLRVIAVESRRRPANFLREVKRRLSLGNLQIVEDRVEEIGGSAEFASRIDVVITRAWAGLGQLLQVASPLLRRGGLAISMRAVRARSEVAAVGRRTDYMEPRFFDYTLPSGKETRTLVIFERC